MDRDLYSLCERVGQHLLARGWAVATAESCTGGWVAKALTDVPGSSGWFDRGLVSYTNRAKRELLGVAQETLERCGAVSEATVREMVAGALAYSGVDVAVAISGIAGPSGGTPDKPVGTVWFAWGRHSGATHAQRMLFAGDREAIRHQSVATALQGILDIE